MTDATLPRAGAGEALDAHVGRAVAYLSSIYARFAAGIGAGVFGVYLLLVALSALLFPEANWDMLPYLATAAESRIPDAAALHDFAYGTVREHVSPGQYAALTTGDPYRERMAADPAAFRSMLPMYRIKALYAELVSVVSLAVDPVRAIRLVSLVSALAFGLTILAWLRREGALALAPVFAALLAVSGFADLARVSTPDMLTSALLLGGAFSFRCRREGLCAALLFLAFLARPDNIVMLAALVVLLALARQWSWGAAAAFAGSLAVYVPLSHWAGHPGWWPHLFFSTIQQQLTMDGFDPAFSLALYGRAFAVSLLRAVTANSWVGVAVLAVAGWFAMGRLGQTFSRREGALFAALLLAMAGKFVIFPIHDTRIYFPNLLPPFLLLAPLFLSAWARMPRAAVSLEGLPS